MISPRLITGNVYEIAGKRYRASFWNLSRKYEFEWVADESGEVGYLHNQTRTELEVSEAILKGIIKSI